MRTRIAACSPKRCSCRAVACGDRGVSCDMGRRPLVRRRWHRGSPFPARQGMPPPAPRPPRSPRQSRLRSRTLLGPVVPRERSEGSTRLPHCRVRMSLAAVLCRPGASVSIRPRRLKCGDMAHPCRRGASPHAIRDTCIASRVAPRRRQPQATAAAPVPDSHRAVRFPGLIEMAPDPPPQGGPKRRGIYTRHQGGTRKECLAALPPLAAMPI